MAEQPAPRRLTRSSDRVLGGVAAGLAEYFEVDPTVVRVLWVLAVLIGFPLAVIGYLVLWVIMPAPGAAPAGAAPLPPRERSKDAGMLVGVVLVAAGVLLLFNEFAFVRWFGWGLMHLTWPLLLILVGVFLLARRGRRSA